MRTAGILAPLCALACAAWSAGAAAAPPAELPGGNSMEFREAMMDWAADGPDAAPVLPAARFSAIARTRGSGAATLPLLSSRFGYRGDPLGKGRRMHAGIDIPGPLGTPIHAAGAGVVRFAGGAGGYGQMVEIDHGNGLSTRYGHLSRFLVRPGEAVGTGQEIALMGSTGRSTGSHLHFEVREGGRATDPIPLLSAAPPSTRAGPEIGAGQWPKAAAPHISGFARRRDAAVQPTILAK